MSWKAIIYIAAVPFILGNVNQEKIVIKRFLASIATGNGYQQEDFVDAPSGDEIAYLTTLKGCKIASAETITGLVGRGWAIEWSCRQKPRSPIAIIYIVDGKIDSILPSKRIGRY